jgi:hypothetical protein
MSHVKGIFWNREEHRLRAGWRLLIQLTLFIVMLVGLAFASKVLGTSPPAVAVGSGLYFFLGLAAAWILACLIDRRPWADYGLHFDKTWWLDFGFGLVLGAILMTGIFAAERLRRLGYGNGAGRYRVGSAAHSGAASERLLLPGGGYQ